MENLSSTCHRSLHDAITLSALENGSYMNLIRNNHNLSVNEIKLKVLEFLQFLNSVGRLSLLECDKSECEEFVFLLLMIKKSIKYTLCELGQSHNKKKYSYTCCECSECINIDPKQNFWTCFQSHDHSENLYYKFLNGTLDPISAIMEEISSEPSVYVANHITDNKIERDQINNVNVELDNENIYNGLGRGNCEIEGARILNTAKKPNSVNEDENVNNFRFNFVLHYDDIIESKIYPESLMKAVRQVDKIENFTIQRAGPFRAVCLLCSCDVVTRSKVSKMPLMDHSMGQRHLRFACNPTNISVLKNYHETWLNLELNYQAHQVYFRPEISSSYKCVLCNVFINRRDILGHIQTDPHKKNVLEIFEKKNNTFYLIDIQVQVYGNILSNIENKDNEIKEKDVPKFKKRHEKTDSDSSPSSDSKVLQHNIIKSVENSTSTNVLDLLPNRFREHLKFLKNGKTITCEACKVSLAKDIETIKRHVRQSAHIKASKIETKKYSYYCEICNVKIFDENLWQRHFTEGPNKHANMAESRKNKTTEYECSNCCTVIYGDELSITRHLSVSLSRERKSKEMRLPEPIKSMFKSIQIIENEGEKLTLEANDTLKYNQLTKECCIKLENTLNVAFEGCKAYPFGSRISGLGNKFSDLDVFIDTGDMYNGYKKQDALTQIQLVRKAAGILSKHKEEFQDVFQIPTARTPIVKLYHKTTEIECDLSFRHGLSVENTAFLRFCLDLQPVTQPFILLLKKWSEHNNLTEHITTYALAIMAIFYLQINNYLLSVKKMRELNPENSLVINGWETIKYTMPFEEMKTFVKPYPYSVSKLLKDFFGYYAKFLYPKYVICPLLGCTIDKNLFYEDTLCEKLPVEMKSYVAQLQSEEPEQFRAMSPFCIQDPFDLSHNLVKACQSGTVNRFKTLCDLTFKHLESLK